MTLAVGMTKKTIQHTLTHEGRMCAVFSLVHFSIQSDACWYEMGTCAIETDLVKMPPHASNQLRKAEGHRFESCHGKSAIVS